MENWKVTWFDGNRLRSLKFYCSDPYSVVNQASNMGINVYAIIKIEQVVQDDL